MAYEYLREERHPGGVAVLTLDRPDKLNAWNAAMRAELREAVAALGQDPELRALILTGAGRAFSAGEDV
ncbi:MAG: enoyl-CoA hydratase/isomerase family protein, partial [Candidatus Dormibacteraeota bacterium]|nr:enoyl-CoA hydratase/isomerase family protein [Candidatus Dormibacteraeota bacterium]